MRELNNLVAINKARTRFNVSITEALDGTNLTSTEWHIIHALYKQAGQIGETAETCGIKVSGISRIIPGLVERDIIYREDNQPDDRSKYLSLTEEGAEIYSELHKKVYRSLTIHDSKIRRLIKG